MFAKAVINVSQATLLAAYSEIGEFFGGRNHATVISADRKVAGWLAGDIKLKVASQTWRLADVIETIEQQLMAG